MKKLIHIKEGEILKHIDLNKDEYTIGRDESNDIIFREAKVSRKHARLTREGNSYFITDLDSANHVRVNGNRIKTRLLESGDIIELSDVVKLLYIKEEKTEKEIKKVK